MIRVLIAHPSRLVCDSLRTSLDKVEDVYVVGCAYTAEELHFLLPHGTIVLLSSEMKGGRAFDLLKEIHLTHAQTKVLVLGLSENPDEIIRYIEAGAAGYILQDESVDDMVEKLQAADDEQAIVSPRMAAFMMERLLILSSMEMPIGFDLERRKYLDELTPREEEVVGLITEGYTNQEIADRLIIECGTVKNHVHNILKKLEVSSRHEAASLYKMQQQPAMAMAV